MDRTTGFAHSTESGSPHLVAARSRQRALSRTDLDELGEVIATTHAAPYSHSTEVEELVERAQREDRLFVGRLAMRALRLERALRDAQERLIHQQWELAQYARREQARGEATQRN